MYSTQGMASFKKFVKAESVERRTKSGVKGSRVNK
jgi:hypothetical protein